MWGFGMLTHYLGVVLVLLNTPTLCKSDLFHPQFYIHVYANAYANRGTAKEMNRDMEGACMDWAKARELGSDVGKAYQSENCEF